MHPDFAERLSKYGLKPDDVHAETLHVSKNSVIYLGTSCKEGQSFHAPRWLQCKSIDDVKAWIGVPNSIFEKNPDLSDQREITKFPPSFLIRKVESCREIMKQEDKDTDNSFSNETLNEVRKYSAELSKLAHSYVYGNSAMLTRWKKVLDYLIIGELVPLWAYTIVIVEAGSVLEFDQATNVLAADQLIIESGGTIRSRGALTIDVGVVKR